MKRKVIHIDGDRSRMTGMDVEPKRSGVLARLWAFLRPSDPWRVPVLIVVGIGAGLVLHLVVVSRAPSYLSDRPETCINCHVMIPQYAGWVRGSHARAATCNDCHVPQDHLVRTYLFKAMDGLRHAAVFTLRLEPQVIRIKAAGRRVTQANCLRCHGATVNGVLHAPLSGEATGAARRLCWDCHREVPHGRVRSLASTPNTLVPRFMAEKGERSDGPRFQKGENE